jgi:ribonuclease HI
MHNKGKCSVVTSAEFLKHYAESLGLTGRAKELTVSRKGKEKIEEGSWSRITGNEDIGGSSNTRKGWAPPEEDWVKLNTDAGFCENTGGASFGVVVRDSQGQALLSAWGTWSHVTSAEEAEALACLEGIRLMIERIGRPTVVETDCESLVAAQCRSGPTGQGSFLKSKRQANYCHSGGSYMPGGRRTWWRMSWQSWLHAHTKAR